MNQEQARETLSGKGEAPLYFEELDQRFLLKVRAFVRLCMPPVFAALEREFGMRELRREGVAPIMHFLEFRTGAQPLAFGGRAETPFSVRLKRSVSGDLSVPAALRNERLLLDMVIDVMAQGGRADPLDPAATDGTEALVHAGQMRVLHVFTRPMAPAGERQVTEVPEPLRRLREQPFEGPYPSVESLSEVPAGYQARELGHWHEQRSVWGLSNTDINQHVNVHEYITGSEDHFARALFGANLPVERHRITRAALLFRRPFFMGEPYGMRGGLWLHGDRTLLQVGFHRVEPEGGLAARPSVFARLEGEIGARA